MHEVEKIEGNYVFQVGRDVWFSSGNSSECKGLIAVERGQLEMSFSPQGFQQATDNTGWTNKFDHLEHFRYL